MKAIRRKSQYTRRLACRLTEEEVRAKLGELSSCVGEIDSLETKYEAAAAVAKAAKDQVKQAQGRQSIIARVINTKTEERQVECDEVLDYDASRVVVMRADTNTVVEVRNMRDSELQVEIFQDGEEEVDLAETRQAVMKFFSAHPDQSIGGFEDPEEDEPGAEEPSLAAQIKERLFAAGEDGLGDQELEASFADPRLGDDIPTGYSAAAWALLHTGEINLRRPDMIYTATSADLVLDVDAMLEAQPELGTEDGLPEDQIVAIPLETAPDLVDVVSVFVHERERVTRLEVIAHFEDLGEDEVAVAAALDWLIEHEKLEANGDDLGRPGTDDLDAMEGEDLREAYENELGAKPGRRTDATMREAIRKSRAFERDPLAGDAPSADEDPQPLED